MRTTNLLLSLAALAGVALLLLRDGGDRASDEGARESNARIDAVELQLATLAEDVRTLLEERRKEGPKLLSASSREQAALEALTRRTAGLEGYLVELRERMAQLSAKPPAVGAKPKEPAKKKEPADPKEVDRWLEGLESEDEDIVFTSTIELARLGDLRATYPLIRVLEGHKDFYARLGAATALGQLQAVASVSALIESLSDKDDLVRTASAAALKRITEKDFGFVSGLAEAKRQGIQGKYREWWRDNEDDVAERLKQGR